MKTIKLTLCLIATFVICGCAQTTTIRQHKDFAQVFPKYRSVAILSADMIIAKKTKNGQEMTMPDPTKINNVAKMASDELTKKGYNVKQVITEDDESEYGDEFNKAYKKSITGLYAKPEMSKTENALSTSESLGTNVAKITGRYGADLLLVLAYTGNEMSQDQVSKSLAADIAINVAVAVLTRGQNSNAGGQPTHIKDGSAAISLIDGHTGNILWTNIGSDFEDYGTSVARMVTKRTVMETAFERALKTLPDKSS